MTFSILTRDPETGVYAAAAATGNLCVGGWVLRGDIEAGLVASQGTAPSTFWRDGALRRMYAGTRAETAVAAETGGDRGREHRQLIALDRRGGTAGFTGAKSVPFAGHICAENCAVAGNMIAGRHVLNAMMAAACENPADPSARMFAALDAASAAGGDTRGLMSAALLILSRDRPPIDLRIDFHETPVPALKSLYDQTQQPSYHDWTGQLPVLSDKSRHS